MSIPENTPSPEPNDPKTNNTEQNVITNSDESDKVVNTDGATGSVADMDGIQETLSEFEPSSADDGLATGSALSHGETPTDAELSGDSPVI